MGTFYEDGMMGLIKQKELLQAAQQARLARLARQDQDELPTLLALAYARFKLGLATLSSRAVRSARVSPKLPLKSRLADTD